MKTITALLAITIATLRKYANGTASAVIGGHDGHEFTNNGMQGEIYYISPHNIFWEHRQKTRKHQMRPSNQIHSFQNNNNDLCNTNGNSHARAAITLSQQKI